MTVKDFIEYIVSIGANDNTELWIFDNDGLYMPLYEGMIEKDIDNSINIHTGIYQRTKSSFLLSQFRRITSKFCLTFILNMLYLHYQIKK